MKKKKVLIERLYGIFMCMMMLILLIPIDSIRAEETKGLNNDYGQVVIKGNMQWNDDNNINGDRPTSIEVSLFANQKEVMKQVVTGPDWNYAFDITHGVKGFDSLVGVAFTVSHPAIDGYETTDIKHPIIDFKDPSMNGGWEKIAPCNELDIDYSDHGMSIVASKMTKGGAVVIWSMEPLALFEREIIINSLKKNANGLGNPKEFEFLSGEGTNTKYGITVNSSSISYKKTSSWSLLFVGTYSKGNSNVTNSYIENTYIPEEISMQIQKIWDDDNDRDGLRPESIEVQLYKTMNNQAIDVGKPVILNASTDWIYQFNKLHKYENGMEVKYGIKEISAVDHYVSNIKEDPNTTNGILITNTHIPTTTSISASKVWFDEDQIHPESVTFALYADGVKVDTSEKEVNETNDWTVEWTELFKKSGGKIIQYTVKEENVPLGYTVSYENEGNHFIITNTKAEQATINVSVNKEWIDNNNQDGIRPASLEVKLLTDGEYTGKTITLTKEDNWTGTFQDLIKYENDKEIVYTIEEVVPKGYEVTNIKKDANTNNIVLVNEHKVETTNITVDKVWEDEANRDGNRPLEVTVRLYANGKETNKVATLKAENEWKYTFEELDKNANGTAITYSVVETEVPSGYLVSYTTNGSVLTVTNTYKPEVKTLEINKKWVDKDNIDKIRPDSVTVQLYKDGEIYGDVIVLTKDNEWKHTLNVMAFENEEKIVWTVEEINVPKGYQVTYNPSTLTITNTHIVKDITDTSANNRIVIWFSLLLVSSIGVLILVDRSRKTENN